MPFSSPSLEQGLLIDENAWTRLIPLLYVGKASHFMAQQYKDRIKILEDHEIYELYGLPRFDPDEQAYYFALTQEGVVSENGI